MMTIEILVLLSDLGILYFVYKEYVSSLETNKVLMQVLNKQRKQKRKISVDRIIKAASVMENA
jgi:hypothetical protein